MPEIIRPGEILKRPLISEGMNTLTREQEIILEKLPSSWRNAITQMQEWPFVDPDEALKAPDTSSFSDFPTADDEIPHDVVPFSEAEPWGRMDDETDRDYELFSFHRASGLSRTYTATAKHFDISQAYISKTASNRGWNDRIRAWDDYREQIYTTQVIEGVKKMATQHAGIANKGIQALSVVFDELLERVKQGKEEDISELNLISFRGLFGLAEKAARALPNLMNAERLSRGLPTELTASVVVKENRITIQSSEELAEIVFGLQNVLGGRESPNGEVGEVIDVEGEEVTDIEDLTE